MLKIARIFTLAILVITVAGIGRVDQVSDIKRYIENDNLYLTNTYDFEDAFGKTEGLALIIGSGKESGIFDPKYVDTISGVEKFLTSLPYSYRIETLTNQDVILSHGDDIRIDSFVNYYHEVSKKPLAVDEIRRSSSLRSRLISPSLDYSVAYVTFNLPEHRMKAVKDIRKSVLRYVDDLRSETGYKVSVTGAVFLESEIIHVADSDSMMLFPAALILSALFIYFVFRSLRIFLYVQAIILITCASVLGVAGYLGIAISNVSSTFSLIIVMITTVNLLHIFSSMARHINDSMPFDEAALRAFSHNAYPIALTCITTVVGFLSLCFLTSPEFPNLGILAAAGCVLTLLYSYVLLQPLILRFPFRMEQYNPAIGNMMKRVVQYAVRNKRAFVATAVALILFGTFGVMNIVPNNDPSRYFSMKTEIGSGQAALLKHMGYDKTVTVLLEREGSIFDPSLVAAITSLQSDIKSYAGVVNVSSYVDMLGKVHEKLQPTIEFDPASMSKENLHQYAFLYEMSLGYGRDMTDYFDFSKSRIKLDIRVGALNNREMLVLSEYIKSRASQLVPGSSVSVSGLDMAFALSGQRTISDMMVGVLFTVSFLFSILLIVTRSVKLAVVGILANIMPAFVVYALKGYISHELSIAGLATIMVVLGIIVDDTIHIIVNYKRSVDKGDTSVQAISVSVPQTAVPIFVSTLIFSTMLFLFCFSEFNENAQIGWLGAPIILMAFIWDVLFLPALVASMEREHVAVPENA